MLYICVHTFIFHYDLVFPLIRLASDTRHTILYGPAQPRNEVFQKLPLVTKNLFKKMFIPSAILILNANV